ncbi:tripartite tricarboxylate transporter substrate binding protein [Variovorax sp.]|uniref:Bug family tripartite tricarboxylate transporter substrate binding protein n=1 Tax=Variovorax sp. TaxID=1871043 RepID=UPI002D6BDAFF|nr:tripartite tricarboxylate transporter substrate binding protein [Variovorax sp.]HYP82337.1 tripartite tricarboxylate transporter substrate binding protein [Variovorax sp.]
MQSDNMTEQAVPSPHPMAVTRRQALLMASAMACVAPAAVAQPRPVAFASRPVTLVVPFTSGSGSDTIARLIGPRLGELWKQAVVVDNRPGASGNLGADRVAKSAPDGQNLLMAINTITATPALYKTLPFDPAADFTPITQLATAGFALIVNPDVPAKDMRSLLAYIKSRPAASLNYASPGNGTPHHLGFELMKQALGIDVVHVPYKGLAGAVTDLMGGQVQMMLATVQSVLPQVQAGRVRMLGVTGSARSPLVPDVPTFREQGISSLEGVDAWYAVLGPAGMAAPLVERLQQDFVQVMQQPDLQKKLAELGLTVHTGSPAELRTLMTTDMARWKKVVADARIQAE